MDPTDEGAFTLYNPVYREIPLNNAVEFFDPATGHRLHVDAPQSSKLRQQAPRSVQFALTNQCNLSCWFCSRPTERASTWTVESALELLADLDRLGVAEVAFGGGEPLVFRGLFELVERLVTETRLAVHMTTNGRLLTDDALDRLKGKLGEIRISLYDDNDWRATLDRLVRRSIRFGVNQLVTPETIDDLPALLNELESRGCRDVLLLPAVGHPSLELSSASTRSLVSLVTERHPKMTLKLGVCWGPELAALPRLFRSSDCGAGHEFLEITSDRHVRPCSFHAEALSFETAEDIIAIWRERSDRLRAHAGCTGCTRGSMPPVPAGRRPAVRSYTAFASNNSGSYTLVGSFETSERASEIAAMLNQLAEDMEDPERTTNPVQKLLRAAGLDAPHDVAEHDDWPDLVYAPSPEAVAVDRQVWWYCGYTISMPSELGHWFYAMGGKVDSELDHTHHPQLAHLALWPDLPWKERREVELQPLIDELWRGPLAAEGIRARVRTTGSSGIEVLWLAPEPDQMGAFMRIATRLGLRARLTITEALTKLPDLDALW